MYSTLDEVYSYCPEELAKLTKLSIFYDQENQFTSEHYAAIALYLSSGYQWDKNAVLDNLNDFSYIEISKEFISYLPKEYDKEYFEALNSILHIEHLKNPSLRNDAINKIGNFKNACELYNGEFSDTLYINPNEFLTGKDDVPKYIEKEIMEVLRPYIEDLGVNMHTSWIYSHIDMGSDYDYSIGEGIDVELNSSRAETLRLAVNAIQKHEFGIGRSVNDLYDAVQNNDINRVKQNIDNGVSPHSYAVDEHNVAIGTPKGLADKLNLKEIIDYFNEYDNQINEAIRQKQLEEIKNRTGTTIPLKIREDAFSEEYLNSVLSEYKCPYEISAVEKKDGYCFVNIYTGSSGDLTYDGSIHNYLNNKLNITSFDYCKEKIKAYYDHFSDKCNNIPDDKDKAVYLKFMKTAKIEDCMLARTYLGLKDNVYNDPPRMFKAREDVQQFFPDIQSQNIELKNMMESFKDSILDNTISVLCGKLEMSSEELEACVKNLENFCQNINENPEQSEEILAKYKIRNTIQDGMQSIENEFKINEDLADTTYYISTAIEDIYYIKNCGYDEYNDICNLVEEKTDALNELSLVCYSCTIAKQTFVEVLTELGFSEYIPEEIMSQISDEIKQGNEYIPEGMSIKEFSEKYNDIDYSEYDETGKPLNYEEPDYDDIPMF